MRPGPVLVAFVARDRASAADVARLLAACGMLARACVTAREAREWEARAADAELLRADRQWRAARRRGQP